MRNFFEKKSKSLICMVYLTIPLLPCKGVENKDKKLSYKLIKNRNIWTIKTLQPPSC